ncbi:MAG: patatin-like phospholipase family protein [Parvularcula sp.]|nr:patatin-like phospholipase family protein [Parvularcula sp.]
MEKKSPCIGVAWGSGAARGWAHVGVIKALEELNIPIDVEAGCSVGSLVSAARRLDIWDEFLSWARSIGPIGAMGQFAISIGAGGLVNPARAFEIFRHADRQIGDLKKPWGAVATDLATGREVWLTSGSVLDAARASSAIPIVMQAAPVMFKGAERWMIDGAASNPVPVSLARALGADRVIAVDLNTTAITLRRFVRPETREVVMVEPDELNETEARLPEPVAHFLRDTRSFIDREIAMAKAKAMSRPHFFETAAATLDIVQAHLSAARALIDVADVRITPDLHDLSPAAFDRHEAILERGYLAAMAKKDALLALAEGCENEDAAQGQ